MLQRVTSRLIVIDRDKIEDLVIQKTLIPPDLPPNCSCGCHRKKIPRETGSGKCLWIVEEKIDCIHVNLFQVLEALWVRCFAGVEMDAMERGRSPGSIAMVARVHDKEEEEEEREVADHRRISPLRLRGADEPLGDQRESRKSHEKEEGEPEGRTDQSHHRCQIVMSYLRYFPSKVR